MSTSDIDPDTMTAAPHRVVIIGSGFGGLYAARKLASANVHVVLIAKTSHHLFQPLLYQVATGILSVGEIAPPTRMVLRDQDNVEVLMGEVTDIDIDKQTVGARLGRRTIVEEYDSLIVAAGADQSYFGNDHFKKYAPGMKTVDDALELRARITGAFERAEFTSDPEERERLLSFVIVGAGPTGVEMAGQVAELANRTLSGTFSRIDPTKAKVILLDAAPTVLPPFGEKLGKIAQKRLEDIGVDVQLNAMVSDVDADGITISDKDGNTRRIETACKIWSAGVAASPLGQQIADQSRAETDRAGRVKVNPDLSVGEYKNVFVVGDMMALDDLPGVAQVAIQTGEYAAATIAREADGSTEPREPFKYFDKGSMATVSRFSAVVKMGRFEISGFAGWVLWLVVHLMFMIGFKNRMTAIVSWGVNVMGNQRSQLTSTEQQFYGRSAIEKLGKGSLTDLNIRDSVHIPSPQDTSNTA